MEPCEYANMAAHEASHWWYAGLRDALTQVLQLQRFSLPENPSVLDIGCGTGQNLVHLECLLDPGYLGGFDISATAVAAARGKAPAADVYQSDLCRPQLHFESFDLVTCCDVIYIPGTEAAMKGLLAIVQRLRPGGLFIVNLPAYDWLYSAHDVVVHTSQRYTRRRVVHMLQQLGLFPELATYRCCTLLPAIVAVRLPSMFGRASQTARPISDVRATLPWLNRALTGILRLENRVAMRHFPLPWGSSVFAVGRKPRADIAPS